MMLMLLSRRTHRLQFPKNKEQNRNDAGGCFVVYKCIQSANQFMYENSEKISAS